MKKFMFGICFQEERWVLMEENFGPFWLNSDIYDDEQKEKIYDVADLMLKKRLRPFPFYKSFIISLLSFPGSPQEGEGFDIGY